MVRPDEGMARLYPGLGAPVGAPVGGAEAGAEADVMVRFGAAADRLSAAARSMAAAARLSWEECHPVDIPPGQSGAAGLLDQSDVWGPRDTWAWHVLMLPAILGPSGTLMTLYRDAPTPTNTVLQSTVSGVFEPRRLILMPGRRLVWSSAGDGLTVCTGIAVEVALSALPAYLMGVG